MIDIHVNDNVYANGNIDADVANVMFDVPIDRSMHGAGSIHQSIEKDASATAGVKYTKTKGSLTFQPGLEKFIRF